MADTRTSLSLAALLGVSLSRSIPSGLTHTVKGTKMLSLKLVQREQMEKSDAVKCNEASRKGQLALTHAQETHPGLSVLLLLECTVKTFSFCWSQWYSTPEFKALETSKKKLLV